jgi:Carboxypeptidase regulatory-like domain
MLRLWLVLAVPVTTWACSCAPPGPACEAAWKASAVFVGTVTDLTREHKTPDASGNIQINGFLGTRAVFEVSEAFIGMEGRGKEVEIRTGMGGGDCGYSFQLGETYLVYAYKTNDGLLTTGICSNTRPAGQAKTDLTYLRSSKDGVPPAFVFGVVGDGESTPQYDPELRTGLWPGLPGARVTLSGPAKTVELTTGDDGRFRFDHLAPGKYQVSVAKAGYSLQFGRTDLDLHAGGCALAMEILVTDRRVTGKVTGADGLPAAGIQVELVPARPTRESSLPFPAYEAKTGDDGTYELRNVKAGEYYLGINLAHTPSEAMPFSRYFYPGTEEPSQAGIVVIKQAPGVETFHFSIPAAQHERTIEGFVYWPDGRPGEQVHILLEDPRWPWQTHTVSATTDAKGHFAVKVFDGTVYRVHAVTMARFTNESISAEPGLVTPGMDMSKPMRLILTYKGNSAAKLAGKGLDRWRAGLGF